MENYSGKVIENILDQAKYYLDHAGEFYPFGSAYDEKNCIVPIGAKMNDENPLSIDVYHSLEEHLKESIKRKRFKCAAIAIQVEFNGVTRKNIQAIEISIFSDIGVSKLYFEIIMGEKEHSFKKINL